MNRTEEIGQERVLPNLPENGQLRNSHLIQYLKTSEYAGDRARPGKLREDPYRR